MKTKILVIEDDPAISTGLKASLETEGYEVLTENDGEKGFNSVLDQRPDIVILDVMLPSMNGFDVCKNLRMKNINTPIIIVSAKDEEADKVLGLELGADDYVTKPFSIRELTARIRAILRRKNEVVQKDEILKFSDIEINFKNMECYKSGIKVNMSLKEFEIMKYFSIHTDEVITRDTLLDKVWGYENFPTTRTVDNYILLLRKKIESNPHLPKHIHTIHSAGYKFVK